MKKYLVLFMFVFIIYSLCYSQSITINSIGMHKDGEPGNFIVSPGDIIEVSVNYSSDSMTSIQGVNFNGTADKVMVYGFSGSIPSGSPNYGYQANIANFIADGPGLNQTATFKITIPAPANSHSFQLSLGLTGLSGVTFTTFNGATYSSYVSVGSFTVAPSLASGDYQSYIENEYDTETINANLYTPISPTIATYDNSSLLVEFKLNETPWPGSVKIYFSNNPDGSNPTTVLTLANSYENTNDQQVTLNAASFSPFSEDLSAVSGEISLTHLETYFIAIGYQDVLGNPESFSSWNKLVYDNQFDLPADCWPWPYYTQNGTDITLSFIINEPTSGNVILRIVPYSADGSDRRIEFENYNFLAGTNTLTIKGNDLRESANFLALLDGVHYLTSGIDYRYQLTLTDLAGNIGTSNQSDPQVFYWDSAVNIEANFSEYEENSTFNSNITNDYQRLGAFRIKTSTGTSQLNSISFNIEEGSKVSNKITKIKIDDAMNSLGLVLDYTGPGLYTFNNIEKNITTSWYNLFFSYLIDYEDNDFTENDFISMNVSQEGVNTTGNLITYTNVEASKFMKHCLIVDHQNIQPSFSSTERETPFFRLDLRTNDHTTQLLNLSSFRVVGSITSEDLIEDRIFLYESNSPTFDRASALLIQDKPRNSEITFNINRQITSSLKYYFFTIKVSGDVNTDHTILGNIISSSDFDINTVSCIESPGFPLNSEAIDEMTLPVELSSFTAVFNLSEGVGLKWVTESETNISGYYLYRSDSDSFDYSIRINPHLITSGSELGSQKTYTFLDDEIEINENYYYWLESLELTGFSDFYGPFHVFTSDVIVEDPLITPTPVNKLLNAYPNPFNPNVHIPYKLVENNSVEIAIFNVKGQKVRSYLRNNQEAGSYSLLFDGKDEQGNPLSSGIYFYRMKTNTITQTKKMILMK